MVGASLKRNAKEIDQQKLFEEVEVVCGGGDRRIGYGVIVAIEQWEIFWE